MTLIGHSPFKLKALPREREHFLEIFKIQVDEILVRFYVLIFLPSAGFHFFVSDKCNKLMILPNKILKSYFDLNII